ncbi:MAG: uracil-DNA glycosylase [Acidimicrobiales bacterium]
MRPSIYIDLEVLAQKAASCTACELSSSRTNVVFGVGNPGADLMFVGEGPGRDEDIAGEPFVGRSGKLLNQLIQQEIGIARAECYIANVVKCRPPNNRDPLEKEITTCWPFLEGQIREIDPVVIVTLGNFATRLLLGTTDGIKKVRGSSYAYPIHGSAGTGEDDTVGGTPSKMSGTTAGGTAEKTTHLVPTFHPAAALRGGPSVVTEMRADFARIRLLLLHPARPTHPDPA